MKGRIASEITFTADRKQRVTIELDEDFRPAWDGLHGEDVEITVKKYRKKRSLDANGFAWILLDRLSEKLRIPKERIYRSLIRDVGGNCTTVCVQDKAVDKLTESWQNNGIGWVTDTMPSKLKDCKIVILYYGSSTYDTAQMSRLLDLIIEECKEQGIETKTPNEIAEMLSLWESAR